MVIFNRGNEPKSHLRMSQATHSLASGGYRLSLVFDQVEAKTLTLRRRCERSAQGPEDKIGLTSARHSWQLLTPSPSGSARSTEPSVRTC